MQGGRDGLPETGGWRPVLGNPSDGRWGIRMPQPQSFLHPPPPPFHWDCQAHLDDGSEVTELAEAGVVGEVAVHAAAQPRLPQLFHHPVLHLRMQAHQVLHAPRVAQLRRVGFAGCAGGDWAWQLTEQASATLSGRGSTNPRRAASQGPMLTRAQASVLPEVSAPATKMLLNSEHSRSADSPRPGLPGSCTSSRNPASEPGGGGAVVVRRRSTSFMACWNARVQALASRTSCGSGGDGIE